MKTPEKRSGSWLKVGLAKLNGPWHKPAMQIFVGLTAAHWAEHVLQVLQVYVLGWPRPKALGLLGLVFPELVRSEWLHYGYAVLMLAGLVLLAPAFLGRGRTWWLWTLGIQIWHHFEHALLLAQAQSGYYLFGLSAPTSLVQLVVPKMELHFIYNLLVTVPMAVAAYLHAYPPAGETVQPVCTCAGHRHRHAVQEGAGR